MAAGAPPSNRKNDRHCNASRGTQAYTHSASAGEVRIGLGAGLPSQGWSG
jgi:hypothetical protein